MYGGSLVQDPEWISSPFAAARIDRPENNRENYYPNTLDNQSFYPKFAYVRDTHAQVESSAEPEEEKESKPPKEDISWREVPQDSSYPTAPFARARIDRPENNRESYSANTLDN
jgi:hypothetical protein